MENSTTLKENFLNDCEKGFTQAENTNILQTDKSLGSSEYVDRVENLENIESIEVLEEIREKMELLKQLTEKVKKLEREAREKTREEIEGLKRRLWRIVFTHYFATVVFTWSVSVLEYRCDMKSIYLFLVIIAQMMNLIFFISAWGRIKVFFTMLSHRYQVKIDSEGGVVTMVNNMDLVTHWVQLGLVTLVTSAAVLYEVYLGVVAYNCGGQVPCLMTLPSKAFLI